VSEKIPRYDLYGPVPPCPVCGEPCKVYFRVSRRGTKTKKGSSHRAGERRTRREVRDTCCKPRCITVLRGRKLAGL
jgi:hypothetical protein